MDKKYFTSKKEIIRWTTLLAIIWFVVNPSVASDLKTLTWLYVGMTIFCVLGISSYCCYPIITENSLIQTNALFGFYKKKYDFSLIDKVVVRYLGYYHFPGMVVYRKGKRWAKAHSLDCMSVRSVKPFVEELRSKGVTVECQPYELDGRMIYL